MKTYENLQELTTQESGVIIFKNNEIIICNWSHCNGVPRLDPLGLTVMGLNEDITTDGKAVTIPNVGSYISNLGNCDLVYDYNNDFESLSNTSGKLYHVNDVIIIAPDGWN